MGIVSKYFVESSMIGSGKLQESQCESGRRRVWEPFWESLCVNKPPHDIRELV